MKSAHVTPFAEDLVDGVYDCPDRIVLNGYCCFAQGPGGFRTWWRRLRGNDDDLDNNSLMRMAGRFSRRLRAWAKANDVDVVYTKERKHLLYPSYLPSDPDFQGVFVIFVNRASAMLWNVERTPNGTIREIRKKISYVNHFSIHVMDRTWGHIVFKICSHPPFNAQIIVNGHEYVARRALKEGLSFDKQGNCFTSVSSGADLARIAETLRRPGAVGQLSRACDRWIYSACLYFALPPEEQNRTQFRYSYFVYQVEYSRNLLFVRGAKMDRAFQEMIDRTRSKLDIRSLKTLFGRQRRPYHQKKSNLPQPRLEVRLERPAYDLTIFKVFFGKLNLKAYTKGERVVRFEATASNVKELKCRRSISSLPTILGLLEAMVSRLLETLACITVSSLPSTVWDQLHLPATLGSRRLPGLDLAKPRIRAVIDSVIELCTDPNGFTTRQLANKVRTRLHRPPEQYSNTAAAYDLAKLRAKGFVQKIPGRVRYAVSLDGIRALAALVSIFDRVIPQVLAGAGKPRPGRPTKPSSDLDKHHRALQSEMRKLFCTLGIAA